MAVQFELLRTRPTSWRPAEARVALNARMDARIVPDSSFAGAPAAGWSGSGSCSGGAQAPGCLPVYQPGRAAPPPGSSIANGAGGGAVGSEQRSGSAAEAGEGCREDDGGGGGPGAHSAERAGCGRGPSGGAGARLHYAHMVVLDDFVGEADRGALLDLLTAPGWDHTRVRAATCSGTWAWPQARSATCSGTWAWSRVRAATYLGTWA